MVHQAAKKEISSFDDERLDEWNCRVLAKLLGNSLKQLKSPSSNETSHTKLNILPSVWEANIDLDTMAFSVLELTLIAHLRYGHFCCGLIVLLKLRRNSK